MWIRQFRIRKTCHEHITRISRWIYLMTSTNVLNLHHISLHHDSIVPCPGMWYLDIQAIWPFMIIQSFFGCTKDLKKRRNLIHIVGISHFQILPTSNFVPPGLKTQQPVTLYEFPPPYSCLQF